MPRPTDARLAAIARAQAKKALAELERIEAALDRAGIVEPEGIAERVEALIDALRTELREKRDREFDDAKPAEQSKLAP